MVPLVILTVCEKKGSKTVVGTSNGRATDNKDRVPHVATATHLGLRCGKKAENRSGIVCLLNKKYYFTIFHVKLKFLYGS